MPFCFLFRSTKPFKTRRQTNYQKGDSFKYFFEHAFFFFLSLFFYKMEERAKKYKVAIVTGANSGVGFGICQRLLETEDDNLTLIMACRNFKRATAAKEKLVSQFPFAHISIELVDVSKMTSVFAFCRSIKEK